MLFEYLTFYKVYNFVKIVTLLARLEPEIINERKGTFVGPTDHVLVK